YQGALIEGGVIDGVGLADWFYAYTAAGLCRSSIPQARNSTTSCTRNGWRPWVSPATTRTVAGDLTALSNTSAGVMSRFGLKVWHCGISRTFIRVIPDRHTPANWRVMRNTRRIQYNIDPGLGIDAATLNREIPRVVPEPGARSYETNPVFAELT